MKKIILIYSLLFTSQLLASNKNFLKCLGSEEKTFHQKKIAGPYLKLNEDLISGFLQMSKTLTIKKKYQVEICQSTESLASLKTLELLLIHKKELFLSESIKGDIVQYSLDQYGKDEIISTALESFVNLINRIQVESGKVNCVTDNIPELRTFYVKTQHVQEEVGLIKLLDEIKDLKTVFKKLNSSSLITGCKTK